MPRKDAITTSGSISAQAQQDLVSEGIENYELPKSVITKIARSAIPENAKLQKETILSLVKGSTVFVNYLAATAHDVAISKQHKSVSATDVLRALEVLELGDLIDGLQTELQIYRELAKTDKSKKGNSSIISANKKAGPTIKLKVKEKATETPSTSTPMSSILEFNESISTGPVQLRADDGETDGENVLQEEEEVEEDEGDEDDDDDEPQDLQDTVAIEQEELRKDGQGLEENAVPNESDKMVID